MQSLHHSSIQALLPEIKKGIVVGVSGGLDSMVLLHILHQCNVPLRVAHVNYSMRAEQSDNDEKLVAETCRKLELPFQTIHTNKHTFSGGNFQENAREFRYNFFKKLLLENEYDWIATAHHLDDQTETRLMKLFRGESFKATTGMSLLDNQNHLFRPLLQFNRQQIVEYAHLNKILWRDDASNAENNYARNLIRNELFPQLDSLTPGWRKHLEELSKRYSVTNELKDLIMPYISSGAGKSLFIHPLLNVTSATRLTLLHAFVTQDVPTVTASQLRELDKLVTSQPGKRIELNSTCSVWRDRDALRIQTSIDEPNEQHVINAIPATLATKHFSSHIQFKHQPSSQNLKIQNTLWLNPIVTKFPIVFRRWETSDRITPLGMKGSVLISDLLVSRGIQPSLKNEAIIISVFDGTICAVIFPHPSHRGYAGCIDHQFRITDQHSDAIVITTEYHP